jgi:hypothetical protein
MSATAFFSKVDKQETIVSANKSYGETKLYVSEFIGKYVCFVRTVSKAGQTAKRSRKLQDFQMFPNLPIDYCLLINIPMMARAVNQLLQEPE